MKYTKLQIEETENGFNYSEEEVSHERIKVKPIIHSYPGKFFLYYSSTKKEEGKKLLLESIKKEITSIKNRYEFLLGSIEKIIMQGGLKS